MSKQWLLVLGSAGDADGCCPGLPTAPLDEDQAVEPAKVLTADAVRASDVVITMGCGDACPVVPGKTYLDWKLEDPAGQGVDAVRPIRDEIERRIRGPLTAVLPGDV
ncbi:arsenate reductase ArsC [Streptomyces sioyaensis]|uniref:arsenate reductase ArsC n=1 Tax=Streptomyces sioyaensis TaxID=67364 RepID=UPI00378B2C6C